ERGACALRREPLAPALARHQPTHLEAGTSLGAVQADPPDQPTARLLLGGPRSVAADPPMAVDVCERAPGRFAVERLALRDVAHRLGVPCDARVRVEIVAAQLAKAQALGL